MVNVRPLRRSRQDCVSLPIYVPPFPSVVAPYSTPPAPLPPLSDAGIHFSLSFLLLFPPQTIAADATTAAGRDTVNREAERNEGMIVVVVVAVVELVASSTPLPCHRHALSASPRQTLGNEMGLYTNPTACVSM